MRKVLIGYFIGENNSGIDKYIISLIKYFNAKNYTVSILTSNRKINKSSFEKKYSASLYVVSSLNNPLKQFFEIKRIIRRQKYDISYFNISDCSNSIGIFAAYQCKVKYRIVHSHSSSMNGKSLKKRCLYLLHLLVKPFMSHLCNKYLACSQIAAKWMFNSTILGSKDFYYIFNYIDTNKYIYSEEIRENVRNSFNWSNKIVIGHIAGFIPVKNHLFSVEILNCLTQIIDNCMMIFIGGGNLQEQIINLIEKKGLVNHAVFLDVRNDVNYLLQGMDAIILPSFKEGLPIAAIEAQVSGADTFLSNTISKEVKISDNCYFLDLNLGARYWSEYILDHISNRANYDHTFFTRYDIENLYKDLDKILMNP